MGGVSTALFLIPLWSIAEVYGFDEATKTGDTKNLGLHLRSLGVVGLLCSSP